MAISVAQMVGCILQELHATANYTLQRTVGVGLGADCVRTLAHRR
jgi:hypothetical protein